MSSFSSMELLLSSSKPPTLLPSMLDMLMAQRVVKGLIPAARYALETLMGRVPLPRVLSEYFDEVFCLGLLLVEWKSVHSGDALLGERLFGLRRSRRIYIQQNSMRTNEVVMPSGSVKKKRSFTNAMVPLSFRDKVVAVLLAVLLPYAKRKLDKLRQKWSESELSYFSERGGGSLLDGANDEERLRLQDNLQRKAHQALMLVYPLVNVLYEGSFFCFQWLYLYRKTVYFDPTLAMASQVVRRMTRQEFELERKNVALERTKRDNNNENSANNIDNNHSSSIGGVGEDKNCQKSVRYGQWVLIAVVLAFKAVEWWVAADEEDQGRRGRYLGRYRSPLMSNRLTPSPPEQPIPSQRGISIPEKHNVCPLCGNIRKNPVILRVSGFVFCYRCALEHLRSVGKCPITLLPCEEGDLCKIYDEEGAIP